MRENPTRPRATPRAVVVGAGVGGLSAAVLLARAGLEVTLLEQHPSVGGKMRSQPVAGQPLDVGPTVLTLRGVFDALFEDAGSRLDDWVTLRRAGILARHQWQDGSRLDLTPDVEVNAEAIAALAGPAEGRGYRAFAAYGRGIYQAVAQPFLDAQRPTLVTVLRETGLAAPARLKAIDALRTMDRSLHRFFRDPRLLELFGRYATYTGGAPTGVPATLNLVAHVEREGVWYVEGGMHRLAEALAGLARALGATVRCATPVAEILKRGGRATGVRTVEGEVIEAEAVVVNADAGALVRGDLGAGLGRAAGLKRRPRSLSAVTWGLLAEARGLPLVRHTVLFSGRPEREFRDIFQAGRLPEHPTVYVCAQDRGDGPAAPGPERLLVLVNAPALGDTGRPTPGEVDACERQVFESMARRGLTLTIHGRWRQDPVAFEGRFPGSGGALYGPLTHGATSVFQRAPARSRLPGLYLAGGSAHPGPGVPMVALSGRRASEAVIADLPSIFASARGPTPGGTSTSSPATAPAA